MYQQLIDQFIQQQLLPASYSDDIDTWFLPLASELKSRCDHARTRPVLIGINGAQGTGKSTLATLLVTLLQANGLRVVNLSIDDFYYTRQERQQLAQSVHPLLSTRGVPGTHDVSLLLSCLDRLRRLTSDQSIRLPAFDKASDDRLPDNAGPDVHGPIDLIILEGWFVGLKPQAASALVEPLNTLEQNEDSDGRWRHYVNDKLGGSYQDVFEQLDYLLMLKAPAFEQVRQWRNLQEDKLRLQTTTPASGIMTTEQIDRFIQYFERLTRHCLASLPSQADTVFTLDAAHRVVARRDQTAPA